MKEANKVLIGLGPHDEESLIKGLIKDFENDKGHSELKGTGGVVMIEPTEKLSYVGETPNDKSETSDHNE